MTADGIDRSLTRPARVGTSAAGVADGMRRRAGSSGRHFTTAPAHVAAAEREVPLVSSRQLHSGSFEDPLL